MVFHFFSLLPACVCKPLVRFLMPELSAIFHPLVAQQDPGGCLPTIPFRCQIQLSLLLPLLSVQLPISLQRLTPSLASRLSSDLKISVAMVLQPQLIADFSGLFIAF